MYALHNGALRVEAFSHPDEARRRAAELGPQALLAGERDSLRIPGFHLGNSPGEFTRDAVAGRVIVSTTTNGTHALLAVADRPRVLVGAFVNLHAVVKALRDDPGPLLLLCAGQDGAETLEDTGCAGAILEALIHAGAADEPTDPAAAAALRTWRAHGDAASLIAASPHAATLAAAGFAADLVAASQVDACSILGVADGRVVRLSQGPRR